MPIGAIQAALDAVSAKQIDNEMGTERYSLLFRPGVYGTGATPLTFQVGYYTEVAGLGASPTDVTINGHVDVYNRCITADHCIALNNFWRSLSNLTINVTHAASMTDCRKTGNFWAASQASPMRRVNVNGNLTLMDYCTNGPQWASGGFIADSRTGNVVNGSQQQYIVRNSSIGSWSNGVWNQVFAGVQGAPATNFGDKLADGQTGTYTTLPTNPASREKPYLYIDPAGEFRVFVPGAQTNSSGTTWTGGPTAGRSIPLSGFFLARPTDSVTAINTALSAGKHLLFTPGVYSIDRSITVDRPDTVVLGMGMATLTSASGAVPLKVADIKGVMIAGLTVDAGPVNSPALMVIGPARGVGAPHCTGCTDASDPTTLSDVFFRIGGPHVGKTDVALEINSDNVILDDIWSWRADHGVDGSVGWNINTSDTGLIVHGNNVTATGLFVEHYKKYNVIWDGDNGTTIFFQNEMPYDPPNQDAWRHGSVLGWAGYKVADTVKSHELWGGGSYIYTNVDPSIHATRAFEVPVTAGVRAHNLLTVQLLAGLIDHVINDTGAVTPGPAAAPSFVISFPGSTPPPQTTPVTTPPVSTPPTTSPTTQPTTTAPPTTTIPPPSTTAPSTTAPSTTAPSTTAPSTTAPSTTAPSTTAPSTTAPSTTAPSTTAPSTTAATGGPTALTVTTTARSATLAWRGDPQASYDILRGEDGVRIATVRGATFTDTGLNPATPYVYSVRGAGGTTGQVRAVTKNLTGGSTPATTSSSPVPTTLLPTTGPPTTGPPTTGPVPTTTVPTTRPSTPTGAPTNLRKTGQTLSSITISWDGSPTASYEILRGEGGARIAVVTGTSFTDTGLFPRTPYVYSVRGIGGTTSQATFSIG